jgi:hypothetical protein
MTRTFSIGGHPKEAPAWLKEIPQTGTKIFFNGETYVVVDVIRYMETGEVRIILGIY